MTKINTITNKNLFFEKDGNFDYYFISSGSCCLQVRLNSKIDKNSITELTIPGEYKGYEVVCIPDFGFNNCNSLTNITISKNIVIIGESAFDGCSSLTKITFPKNNVTICERAFKDCKKLKDINISIGTKLSIGDYSFFNCKSLNRFIIDNNIEYYTTTSFKNTKCTARGVVNGTISTITKVILLFVICLVLSCTFKLFGPVVSYYASSFVDFIKDFNEDLNRPIFSDDDNHSSNSYCQFDGCHNKAVGPTYEFCEYHKNALDGIWDNE